MTPGDAIAALAIADWVRLCAVTLVAATVQGVAGFGFTLVAIAFFLVMLGSVDAIQLVLLINLAISLSLVARLWRDVPRALFGRLITGAAVGFPLGLAAFVSANGAGLRLAVAVAILVFSTTLFWQRWRGRAPAAAHRGFRARSAIATGVLSGALTTSLGMPGPAIAVYLTALGMDKAALRAISLTLFAVCYAVAVVLQGWAVGIDRHLWPLAAVLLPCAMLGGSLGHRVAGLISQRAFEKVVLVLLAVTGGYLLVTT